MASPSRSTTATTPSTAGSDADSSFRTILYALDFDGVLVDSAAETGLSVLAAAKILWKDASWIQALDGNDADANKKQAMIDRFCHVRPCLETGWEAALIVKLLADPAEGTPDDAEILQRFQSELKSSLMEKLGISQDACKEALETARNAWIDQESSSSSSNIHQGQDWLDAHEFYEGACDVVRKLLETQGNANVYIITTKAKEYATRLLERQGLFEKQETEPNNIKEGGIIRSLVTADARMEETEPGGGITTTTSTHTCFIKDSHIYGLGSGPKPQVLRSILKDRQAYMAIMVEDNLLTLQKIMASDCHDKVLPVLASWGYNTAEHQEQARQAHYVVLDPTDSSSLSKVVHNADSVQSLFQEFQSARLHPN